MQFRNQTPFPALGFEGIDQFNQAFHVVALRQTLTWGGDGELRYAEEQAPLCESDEFFGEITSSSVRQESDLCQYKPKCDFIVNATAYAPLGKSVRRCGVRIALMRPDHSASMPERPHGLNPFTAPEEHRMEEWRAAVKHAEQNSVPGERLVDKSLTVTGERALVRRLSPIRIGAAIVRLGSLGLISVPTWRLTSPQMFSPFPLRNEYAYGGSRRINRGDRAAKWVARKHRLKADEVAAQSYDHAPPAEQAIARCAFESNAVGCGFAPRWYLFATGVKRLPAPRVEAVDNPFSATQFWKIPTLNSEKISRKVLTVAGFGTRSRVHPHRRDLAGTIDQRFINSGDWLPKDFDFNVWNAAPTDQQTDFLSGNEIIELTNLCAPASPGATLGPTGDTILRLRLPGHVCTLLMRMRDGTMFFNPMQIDTLIVEPETQTLSIVWRAVFAKTPEIRAADAYLHGRFEAQYSRHLLNDPEKTSVPDHRKMALDAGKEEFHG